MKKFLLPLLFVACSAAQAQTVTNKISFQKAQKIEVSTNANMSSESMMGSTTGNIIMTDTYTVNDATGGSAVLLKAPKQIKLNLTLMGKDYSIDSDNKSDLEGQLGEPIKELMKKQAEFTVDVTGKITAVKADAKKKTEEESSAMGMMIPGMNMAAAAPKVGAASIFKILPDHAIAKGDSWTDSTNEAGNKSKTFYTVKDITASDVLLDFSGDATTVNSQSAMGMSFDVTSNSKTSGTITIDKTTGIMKQKTLTTSADSNVNMGGQEITSTVKTTAVINVKLL